MEVLAVEHLPRAGLFSNCSVRLHWIVGYFNEHKRLPAQVCSKRQFIQFQHNPEIDVAKILFSEREDLQITYRHPIDYVHTKQFTNYRLLPLQDLRPLLEKYFTIAPVVVEREAALIQQYGLDFAKTIGVRYRGNDKIKETKLAPYELFFQKAEELLQRHPGMRFLVQTDELEFRDEFCARFPNSVYFESLPVIPRDPKVSVRPTADNRVSFAIELLSAIRCLAQTAHLISCSGNGEIWTVFFRGQAENVHQFLNDRFLDQDETLAG